MNFSILYGRAVLIVGWPTFSLYKCMASNLLGRGRMLFHRLENRCVLRHISNMNFHSWAVLGSRGCRERNPNCHKYATFKDSYSMFTWAKNNFTNFSKTH